MSKIAYKKEILGEDTDTIAKAEGVHPETVRRYVRSKEYDSFTGHFQTHIDSIVPEAHSLLMREIKAGTKEGIRAAREIFNNIVSKTVGGKVKEGEQAEETSSRALREEFEHLSGQEQETGHILAETDTSPEG